jgi:hypothetical protein
MSRPGRRRGCNYSFQDGKIVSISKPAVVATGNLIGPLIFMSQPDGSSELDDFSAEDYLEGLEDLDAEEEEDDELKVWPDETELDSPSGLDWSDPESGVSRKKRHSDLYQALRIALFVQRHRERALSCSSKKELIDWILEALFRRKSSYSPSSIRRRLDDLGVLEVGRQGQTGCQQTVSRLLELGLQRAAGWED